MTLGLSTFGDESVGASMTIKVVIDGACRDKATALVETRALAATQGRQLAVSRIMAHCASNRLRS